MTALASKRPEQLCHCVMFSMRDVLDIAVKLEENGERIYREASRNTADPRLAELLRHLADQEAEHARWFAALPAQCPTPDTDSALARMGRGMLRNVVGEGCLSLDDVDFTRIDSVVQLLETAIDFENDTVTFFEMIAGFVQDPETLTRLQSIIQEEMRHASALVEYVSQATALVSVS